MILHHDAQPEVEVDDATFKRFLRFPPTRDYTEAMEEAAVWARDWFSAHGRPWVIAVKANDHIRTLYPAEVGSETPLAVVIASAGPEAEQHAAECWENEEPDRYYFLESYAAAVADRLLIRTRDQLGASRHLSPGYPDWSVADNIPLLASLQNAVNLPGPLTSLESGMLVPKKSQIAVFPYALQPSDKN